MNDDAQTLPQRPSLKINWPVIIGFATLVLAALGLIPAYFVFWHKPDTVFDERAVEIPLSEEMRERFDEALTHAPWQKAVENTPQEYPVTAFPRTLPDKLLYVNIRDVGHVPSSRIRVEIIVPGTIQDKEIKDAGPAFGRIGQHTISDREISFECQHLSDQEQAKLGVAVCYTQKSPGPPTVQIEDSEGPAREVGSIETAHFSFYPLGAFGSLIFSFLGVAIAGFVNGWMIYNHATGPAVNGS